jgi:hypothetical protein
MKFGEKQIFQIKKKFEAKCVASFLQNTAIFEKTIRKAPIFHRK